MSHIIGEIGGLAVDRSAIGLIIGVLILLMGVANWFLAARFADVMRREPGWYGRRSSTLFLVGIGLFLSVVSLINLGHRQLSGFYQPPAAGPTRSVASEHESHSRR